MTTDELKAYLALSEKADASLAEQFASRELRDAWNGFITDSRTIGPAAARELLRAVELLREWMNERSKMLVIPIGAEERTSAFLAELEGKS